MTSWPLITVFTRTSVWSPRITSKPRTERAKSMSGPVGLPIASRPVAPRWQTAMRTCARRALSAASLVIAAAAGSVTMSVPIRPGAVSDAASGLVIPTTPTRRPPVDAVRSAEAPTRVRLPMSGSRLAARYR
jgi:hypothetical protein